MPHGAFYVFPNISGTGMNGSEMADKLLYDGGVCALSGTAFGKVGKDHIRISYANSQANLQARARAHRRRSREDTDCRPRLISDRGKACGE